MCRLPRVLLVAAVLSMGGGCAMFTGPAPEEGWSEFPGPRRQFRQQVRSWRTLQRQNVVMQQSDYSCGAAALATVIRYYWGDEVTEKEFLEVIIESVISRDELKDRVENGLTMTDLRLAAVEKGYLASMGRRSLAQLAESRIPVIVRIEKDGYDHFVVFRGMADDRVFLADPIRGNLRISVEEFATQWTDGAILVVVKPNTKPPESSPLLVDHPIPVQHEIQAARRSLFLKP